MTMHELTRRSFLGMAGGAGLACTAVPAAARAGVQTQTRAYTVQGPGRIALRSVDLPAPGPSELLVAVKAVSLNHRDLWILDSPARAEPGLIPCSDAAGIVTAVGREVTTAQIGDRVISTFFPDWPAGRETDRAMATALGGEVPGVLAEHVILKETGIIPCPDYLSFGEACTLPTAALTAWRALIDIAGVTAGQTVLLQGTGGVSIFGLQLAAAAGARTIITSSSDRKLAVAARLGADHTINYRREADWDDRVRRLTDGHGADLILEVAGTLEKSMRAVRKTGTLVLIGSFDYSRLINPSDLYERLQTLRAIYVGNRESFADMNRALSVHGIRPHIDRRFPFTHAAGAFDHLRAAGHVGKVVVEMDS